MSNKGINRYMKYKKRMSDKTEKIQITKHNTISEKYEINGDVIKFSDDFVYSIADSLKELKSRFMNNMNIYFAHGTNGIGLRGILETNCTILPGNILRKQAKVVFSGESAATTPFNENKISVVSCSYFSSSTTSVFGYMDSCVKYANNAANGFSITPKNIGERIKSIEKIIKKEKGNSYPIDSPYGAYIYGLPKQKENLLIIKDIFKKMSKNELDLYNNFSALPVVLLGKSNENPGIVKSHVSGESSLSHLKIDTVAVPKEKIPSILNLLRRNNLAEQVLVVPLESLASEHNNCLTQIHRPG